MAPQGVNSTLSAILECVDSALVDSNRPVCTVGATIGDPVIMQCPECAQGADGELWGHLLRAYQADRNTGAELRGRKPCAPTFWYAQFRLTLARCFPTIDESGDLPDPADLTRAAAEMHADAAVLQTALNCCTEFDEVPYVEQIAVTVAPAGGVSILTATVRVPVSMGLARNKRPSE